MKEEQRMPDWRKALSLLGTTAVALLLCIIVVFVSTTFGSVFTGGGTGSVSSQVSPTASHAGKGDASSDSNSKQNGSSGNVSSGTSGQAQSEIVSEDGSAASPVVSGKTDSASSDGKGTGKTVKELNDAAAGSLLYTWYGCLITEIIVLLVFVGMLYAPFWYEGDRDRSRYRFGGLKKDPLRGLRVSLWLMVPFAISDILLILAKCRILSDGYWALYKLINAYIWPICQWVGPNIFDASAVPWWAVFTCIACTFIIPVLGTTAYLLGYYEVSLSEKLVYKKKSIGSDFHQK